MKSTSSKHMLRAMSLALICGVSANAFAAKKSASHSKQSNQPTLAMNSSAPASSMSMPASATLQTSIPTPKSAEESSEKQRSLNVTFGLLGSSTEDKLVNSKYGGGTVEVTGNNRFSDMLNAELNTLVLMTTGSYTSQYDQGGKPPNGILLGRALLDFTPIKETSFKIGILDTSFSDQPTFMEPTGFPALRQALSSSNDYVKGEVFAFQGIPTSDTATVRPAEGGVTSSFMSYGASAEFNPDAKAGPFKAGLSYARWQFNHMTSSAAEDSQYLGNTVTSTGSRPRFKYDFSGYEAGGSMSVRVLHWLRPEISGVTILNEKAADQFGKGYMYGAGITFKFGDHEIKPSMNYYYNEPDTLPASYARIGRSYNNRFGNQIAVNYKNAKSKTSAVVRYTTANEIDDKPYTADRKVISLVLEQGYDFL